jgi:hypothetical protein
MILQSAIRFGRRLWRGVRWLAGWMPLTALSVLALPVLVLVYRIYVVQWQDRILQAICVCGVGLIALQTALVLLTALWLRLRRERPGSLLELETGTAIRTGWRLGRVRWNPLVKVEVEWLNPVGVEVKLVPDCGGPYEEVTASERGVYNRVVRRFHITDAFGLARFHFRRTSTQELLIRPGCGRVNSLELLPHDVAGDQVSDPRGEPKGDLVEMRAYAPGDPLKLVLWKIYSRTGRLLVRQPERAIAACTKTLAYLVAADADDPSAGVARAVLERGILGPDFLFAADGDEKPTRETGEGLDRIVRSAAAREQGGEALGRVLGTGAAQGIEACLLFVPGQPGPWLNRVAEHLSSRRGGCRAIVGTDGPPLRTKRNRLQRLLLQSDSRMGATSSELLEVCQRLRNAGADVFIVDRTSGTFSPGPETIR